MGYDVHITRREEWSDPEPPEITAEEWIAVVRGDPEMRLDGYAETQLPDGSVLRAEDSSMAVWTAYSKHGVGGNMAWIWHAGGNVMAKNPDEEMLCKMWKLAQKLEARVQGDEGELYGSDGQPLSAREPAPSAKSKPWWRFW